MGVSLSGATGPVLDFEKGCGVGSGGAGRLAEHREGEPLWCWRNGHLDRSYGSADPGRRGLDGNPTGVTDAVAVRCCLNRRRGRQARLEGELSARARMRTRNRHASHCDQEQECRSGPDPGVRSHRMSKLAKIDGRVKRASRALRPHANAVCFTACQGPSQYNGYRIPGRSPVARSG